jgi:hypothetical protein
MRPEDLRDWIADYNDKALMADGFEEAIIGVGERCGQPFLVVYDAHKCIDILVKRDGMTLEEAAEFFTFNTVGSWAGEHTPIFLWRHEDEG